MCLKLSLGRRRVCEIDAPVWIFNLLHRAFDNGWMDVESHDDVGIVFCSKRMLNENKQTKILFDMHFVDHSNFSSLNLVSSRS